MHSGHEKYWNKGRQKDMFKKVVQLFDKNRNPRLPSKFVYMLPLVRRSLPLFLTSFQNDKRLPSRIKFLSNVFIYRLMVFYFFFFLCLSLLLAYSPRNYQTVRSCSTSETNTVTTASVG